MMLGWLEVVPWRGIHEPADRYELRRSAVVEISRRPGLRRAMKPYRVLLAEDHRLVRAGLRAVLEEMGCVEVVGEADDGREALRMIARHRPGLVLMDISMPNLNGLEATRRIMHDYPNVLVIILSMHAGDEYVHQALRAGARGYLLKEAAPRDLQLAIEAAARGEIFISPAISRRIVKSVNNIAVKHEPLDELSPRQREILQLIAEGKSTKRIAALLDTSVKTVETHRATLMRRLDIHDVPGLVRYAVHHGLVSAEI